MSGSIFNCRNNSVTVDLCGSGSFSATYAKPSDYDPARGPSNGCRNGSVESRITKEACNVDCITVTVVRTKRRIQENDQRQIHHANVLFLYSEESCRQQDSRRGYKRNKLRTSVNALLEEILEKKFSGVVRLDENESAALAFRLTARQEHIAKRLSRGETNKSIAAAMGIAENTVKAHVRNILVRAKVRSRKDLLGDSSPLLMQDEARQSKNGVSRCGD